jgi:hypothetical protein
VSGIKTGSSTPAGGNLLWAADTVVDGKSYRILGIVMGIQKADTLFDKLTLATSDSGKLIKAAQTGVVPDTVVQEGEVIGSVADGLGGTTPVVATKDLKAVGWSGLRVAISLRTEAGGIPHSAKAGTVVGSLSIGSGAVRTTVPIALQRALVEPGFGAKLTRLG